MEFRKRRLEAAEAEAKRQQDAQAAEEKKRNCAQATNRLTALEAGGRVTKYGPNGETALPLRWRDRQRAGRGPQGRRLVVQVVRSSVISDP